MTSRQNKSRAAKATRNSLSEVSAGGHADAPVSPSVHDSVMRKLEKSRQLLDQGHSREAEANITAAIRAAAGEQTLTALARSALSEALESQGRYQEAFEAVQMYETPEARAKLKLEISLHLRVRLGLAYNYTGDYPKAIAVLNMSLREAKLADLTALRGEINTALARVYRSINEYTIARDFSQKALDCYRQTGDWRGLAESYFGLSVADIHEGRSEALLANCEQALQLIGDRPAPHLLGKIYANMAGGCWFLKRPQDGIRYLEKAIEYYERTEHKANATLGYNNLGMNLILVGEWDRAEKAFERALDLAYEIGESAGRISISMVLDSLAELWMLRGDHQAALELLERAATLATAAGNKWYLGQVRRSLGRCLLATGSVERARAEGEESLALEEQIGNRRAVCESHLLLAEVDLRQGAYDASLARLQSVSEMANEFEDNLAILGAAQRVYGLVYMARKDSPRAIHHLGRSLSIFEMLGDRYRSALAEYELGVAYSALEPRRAAESFSQSARAFRALGAARDLRLAEEALGALGQEEGAGEEHAVPSVSVGADARRALSPLLTLRLAEAAIQRELLLHELAAVMQQEIGARQILILEPEPTGLFRVAVTRGYSEEEKKSLVESLRTTAQAGGNLEQWASSNAAELIRLTPASAPPAIVVVTPRWRSLLRDEMTLAPLLRVAEMGLELCAYRGNVQDAQAGPKRKANANQTILPGFIYSSPAMSSLVDEITKIRSSDVTVLITGESGTGKELVARAIHALSSRRDKTFLAFNCTAVPKELTEGYLFGYRKGAFTGAVSDSPGVLRSASGGTLFLDEIGDLAPEVQPKLLRFLQEGEIQPLGEQRPLKVDVRIIAATNSDLEQMVEERRFREDLYYRLNVIRVRVPPLRERRSEIQLLIHHYLEYYAQKFKRHDIQITPQAVDLLTVYDWPGNIRQLCNEIQRVVALAEDGAVITPQQLSQGLLPVPASSTAQSQGPARSSAREAGELLHQSLSDAVDQLEQQMIAEALRKHGGNVSRAARELGLTRRGLQLKLQRYKKAADELP